MAKNDDKMKQKATNLEYKNGLTPFQESVAACLAGGKTIAVGQIQTVKSRLTRKSYEKLGVFLAYLMRFIIIYLYSVKNNFQ